METNQNYSQQKRKYFPIELPNGKIKYVRDRTSFREKHKLYHFKSMQREALEAKIQVFSVSFLLQI